MVRRRHYNVKETLQVRGNVAKSIATLRRRFGIIKQNLTVGILISAHLLIIMEMER